MGARSTSELGLKPAVIRADVLAMRATWICAGVLATIQTVTLCAVVLATLSSSS